MKNHVQIALIILFAVLYFNQCNTSNTYKKTNTNNALAFLDTVKFYENKLGLEVAEKRTFKGTAADLKTLFDAEKAKSKQFSEASKKFKKLYNAAIIKVEFKAKYVDIPFEKPINFEFTRHFSKKTKAYSFSGSVNEFGIKLDALATATITPLTGIKSIGLFKREHATEITSSNKLMKVRGFNNYTFKPKEKRFGIGFSFGFGVYSNGLFIGPSINYNIIKF